MGREGSGGGPAEPIMQPKIMQQIRGIPGGAAQDKAAPAVERQDRYEFVLLFVWKEPLSAASLFETAAQP